MGLHSGRLQPCPQTGGSEWQWYNDKARITAVKSFTVQARTYFGEASVTKKKKFSDIAARTSTKLRTQRPGHSRPPS
jgi:hypothetical protein